MRVLVKNWINNYKERTSMGPRCWYANLEQQNSTNSTALVQQRNGKIPDKNEDLHALAEEKADSCQNYRDNIKHEGGTKTSFNGQNGENDVAWFDLTQCIPTGMHRYLDNLLARDDIEFPDYGPPNPVLNDDQYLNEIKYSYKDDDFVSPAEIFENYSEVSEIDFAIDENELDIAEYQLFDGVNFDWEGFHDWEDDVAVGPIDVVDVTPSARQKG